MLILKLKIDVPWSKHLIQPLLGNPAHGNPYNVRPPPVIRCFINPIRFGYKHHKP